MTEADRSIHADQFLAHPPALVWRALTEPELIARWLMPNDFRPVVGHRFTFRTEPVPAGRFDGIVHCEVLDLAPERLLRISWRGGPDLDTTVTWRLVPEGTGTRLFVEHDGFDPDNPWHQVARRVMGGGWRTHIPDALATLLAFLAPLPASPLASPLPPASPPSPSPPIKE
jgi:uncharacterized protein YndB with AHSA1/START domain